jgi:hypothetical protein
MPLFPSSSLRSWVTTFQVVGRGTGRLFKGDEVYARLAFASPAIDGIIDKKHRRPVHPTP